MTDEERVLLHGLEERIDILQDALLKAYTVQEAKLSVVTTRVNSIVEVVNSHSIKIEQLKQIVESMTSYTQSTDTEDDDGYIN